MASAEKEEEDEDEEGARRRRSRERTVKRRAVTTSVSPGRAFRRRVKTQRGVVAASPQEE